MSDNLELKVATNWDEISKLRQEITKLELALDKVGDNRFSAEFDQMQDDLRLAKDRMRELVKANVELANSFDGQLGNSVNALRGYMHDLDTSIADNERTIGRLNDMMKKFQNEISGMEKGTTMYEAKSKQIQKLKDLIDETESETRQLTESRKQAQLTIDALRLREDDLTESYEEQSDKIHNASANLQQSLLSMATKFAGGYGLFSFIDKMKSTRAEFQNMEAAMTTIVGKNTAGQLMEDLKELAKQSPLSMQAMVGAEKMMLSFGISSKESTKYLKALSDVSMGQSSNFNSLALAFSQMSSAGKLMGQDLMQMVNAGFNPLEEISRKTGKSIGVLKEEMSKGAISAKMVQEAFISATQEGGKFYGMSEATANTISGQLSMLGDAWDNLFNDLGKSAEGLFIGTIKATTELVKNFDKVAIVIGGLVSAYGALKAAELVEMTMTSNLTLLKQKHIIGLHANAAALKSLTFSQQMSAIKTIAMTKAQLALNAAMRACPYMLLITAFAAIGTAVYTFWSNSRKASEGQRNLADAIEGAQEKTHNEVTQLEILQKKLSLVEKGSTEYIKIKEQLKNVAGQYNIKLNEENGLLLDNAENWEKVKKAMLGASATQAYQKWKQEDDKRFEKVLDEYKGDIKDLDRSEGNVTSWAAIQKIEIAAATGELDKFREKSANAYDVYKLLGKELTEDLKKQRRGIQIAAELSDMINEIVKKRRLDEQAKESFVTKLGASSGATEHRETKDIVESIEAAHKNMIESRVMMDKLEKGTKEYNDAKTAYDNAQADYLKYLEEYQKATGQNYDKELESLSVIIKRISDNKKFLDDLRKQLKEAKTQAEQKMLETRIKETESRINADKATYKNRTGKDFDKMTEDETKRVETLARELQQFRKEQAKKEQEQAYQDARKLSKIKIDAMQEGYEKQKKLREYERDGEIHDIKKTYEDRKKNLISEANKEFELKQKLDEAQAKKEGRQFIKTTFNEDAYKKSNSYKQAEKALNEQRDAEIDATQKRNAQKDKVALEETLRQYQTFQEKRADIAKKYAPVIQQIEEEIQKALDNGDQLAVAKLNDNKSNVIQAKGKELMEIGFEEMKKGGLYELLFSDLANASTEALQTMMDKLIEFGGTIPENLDPASIKAYTDAVQKLKDELYSRDTDKSVFDQFGESITKAKKTADEETKAKAEVDAAVAERKRVQSRLEQAEARKKLADSIKEKDPNDPLVIQESASAQEELTRATIEYNEAVKTEVNANKKYTAAIKANSDAHNELAKKASNVKKTISDIGNVAQQAGAILGEEGEEAAKFITGIGDMATNILSAVELTSKGASEAISAAERASVILGIIQAAMRILQQLTSLFPDENKKEEDARAKQAEINSLTTAVDQYRRAVLQAQLAEKTWFSGTSIGNLQNEYELGLNALHNYYNKANEMQRTYKDKKGKVGLGLQLTGFGDLWDSGSVKSVTNKYSKALDNLRIETQSARNAKLFKKARNQKTESLQDWITKNMGEDLQLFDDEGLINLELANTLLENYGNKMVGETKETLEQLVEARKEYDAYMESLKSFVSDAFSPLVDNLTDSIMTWLDTGEDALMNFQESASQTFRNIAQDMLKQLALNSVFGSYEEEVTDLYGDFNKKVADLQKRQKEQNMSSEKYNAEYAKLQQELVNGVAQVTSGVMEKAEQQIPTLQEMAKTIDAQLNQVGIDISKNELNQEATAGGFKTMSEETATELNGRFTAVYEGELRIENAMSQFTATMQTLMVQGNDIASQTQELIANSYLELQEINTRVGVSNEQLNTIVTIVTKIQKAI